MHVMCVYAYMCACVSTSLLVHVYVHNICTCVNTYCIYTHAHTCICMCPHMFTCVCVCMHGYRFACVCMHTHACICMHVHVHMCICVHMPVCMYVHVKSVWWGVQLAWVL